MYEGVIQDLIDELGRLPGVGPKGAQRIAFHLLNADSADVKRLADSLIEVKDKVHFCKTCYNVAQAEQCRICADVRRELTAICVRLSALANFVVATTFLVARLIRWKVLAPMICASRNSWCV